MATIEKPRSVFGEKLRAELKRQDLSVRALSKRLDPANSEQARRALAKWIAAKPPSPSKESRRAVAAALGLDPSFFDEDDDEEEADLARALLRVVRRVVQHEKSLQAEGI